MPNQKSIDRVENPFIRAFLRDNLSAFAKDVQVFSEQLLANVPVERKRFVKSAGFVFYSTPILILVPDLPWERIKAAIARGVSGVLCTNVGGHGESEKVVPEAFDKGSVGAELIEQAIVAAFVSICESAGSSIGTLLVGGVANLLGKYVALYIAGILDEAIEDEFWPILQMPSASTVGTRPAN